MKYSVRSYFGILLALTFALSSCKKDEITARDISVLNYNIAGLPQVLSSSNPELYTSHISRLLNEYSIVHVQEDFCYHDSLLLFDNHPYRTESTGCVPDGDGVNTLSCFPISNVERFAWEDCTGPDCLTPKGFYYSQIEVLPGKTIDFYNVHCNAGGSAESLAARRGNIKQVCNHIAQHSEGQAIIIMGDFNPKNNNKSELVKMLVKDKYNIKVAPDGNTTNKTRSGYCAQLGKFWNESKVCKDMIFIRKENLVCNTEEVFPSISELISEKWIGDHSAVIVNIQM